MLVFTLKTGDSFRIAENITVKLLRRHGDGYRIGIDAPKEINIQRDKVIAKIKIDMASGIPIDTIRRAIDDAEQLEQIA
jgi:carbon storage regulator